jgi:hypothetical protein
MFSIQKAAYTRQLAFSLLLFTALISCKEDGSLGAGFVDESTIKADTLYLNNINIDSANAYTGKLAFSPMGAFNDPLFGSINSFAFIRPSIANSYSDSTILDAQLLLRLAISEDLFYGNEEGSATFGIYPVQNFWRGNAYRLNNDINLGENPERLASFNIADADTNGFLDIPLSGSYIADYLSFLNNQENNRDSTYRYNNFGLAIVPDAGTDKIVYSRMLSGRLFTITTNNDTLLNTIVDWGYDIDITAPAVPQNNFSLSSILSNYAVINFDELTDGFNTQNFVRAELQFTENTTQLESTLPAGAQRYDEPILRILLGPSIDVAYDLTFTTAIGQGVYNNGTYTFNVTGLFNAALFGNTDISSVYLFAAPNGGLISFNALFGSGTGTDIAPKLIIYKLVSE